MFSDANLMANTGQRIGIVGNNVSGKSSFLSMIQGDVLQDQGSMDYPDDWHISYVRQQLDNLGQTALDYVLDGDTKFRQAEQTLLLAESGHDAIGIAEAHEKMQQIDGYSATARAGKLLDGLGIAQADFNKTVGEFSGGWQMRLALARALMGASDILLLDEPTNHLDLDAITWLERWLSGYGGVLLVVSHDRDFLDRCTNQIWHIEAQQVQTYSGNYSEFERLRALRILQIENQAKKQHQMMANMERFITRFRAKATKAKQVQSRIKALEKLSLVSVVTDDLDYSIEFLEPEREADPLLSFRLVKVGYGDKVILQQVNLEIRSGQRIAILGRNGAGKSTLIKTLAGELAVLAGQQDASAYLKVGYLAQHQLETFHPEDSAVSYMIRENPQMSEQEVKNFLGRFGFGGRFSQGVSSFSGGEKTRLALAAIIWQRPNLLLLDEPTNHLDLAMREAIILALQSFEGAMILVSHDRHLIRHCADQLYLVKEGQLSEFEEDLDAYQKWLSIKETREADHDSAERSFSRKEQKRQEAITRQAVSARRKPIERQIKQIEMQMDQLASELTQVDALLHQPDFYQGEDKCAIQSTLTRQHQISKKLAELEDSWLSCQTQWESLQDS